MDRRRRSDAVRASGAAAVMITTPIAPAAAGTTQLSGPGDPGLMAFSMSVVALATVIAHPTARMAAAGGAGIR
jgi:hypothetical protein